MEFVQNKRLWEYDSSLQGNKICTALKNNCLFLKNVFRPSIVTQRLFGKKFINVNG